MNFDGWPLKMFIWEIKFFWIFFCFYDDVITDNNWNLAISQFWLHIAISGDILDGFSWLTPKMFMKNKNVLDDNLLFVCFMMS